MPYTGPLRKAGYTVPASLALLVSACNNSNKDVLADARKHGYVRVALTGTNPPWSFLDHEGQVVGFDADVSRELTRRMHISRVRFIQSDFQNFIPGVNNDKFDIVISGQTITPERAKEVSFSHPYEVNGVAIFVNQADDTIHGKGDLAGKRIAVSAGSTQEQLARAIPRTRVLTYDNATLALTDVSLGRAEAWIGSRFVGAYLAQKSNLQVKAVPGYLSSEINAMTIKHGQRAMVTAADSALPSMITDGTFSAISRKWLAGLDMAAELRKLPTDQPTS